MAMAIDTVRYRGWMGGGLNEARGQAEVEAQAGAGADAYAYAAWRERLYGPIREAGVFAWDRMYGEEYAVASCIRISPALRKEIAEATERLGVVYNRTLQMARLGDDALFEALGLPSETWGAVRVTSSDAYPTVIGRFDWAETADGLKMLELNSDTPTSIVEAYEVNGRICAQLGLQDPNAGMAAHLREALQAAVDAYAAQGHAVDRVAFSALDWHEEDAGTTRYLLARSGLTHARFVPLADLRVFEDRLCEWRGDTGVHEPIDLLYRLHALEKLAEERDEGDGYPTGAHVLDLMARGRLSVLNPPAAFLAQSKAFQALIWNLHEAGEFYTAEEHETIERYMLPTYMENRFEGVRPYVSKPIFGREGGAVTLYGADGSVQEKDGEAQYWEQPMVYQQRVELPVVELETEKGLEACRLLWGSFLIGGRASAIVARAGGRITGNLSYYVPVGLG
ncbi:glutathionylspermidine synthase family protein [Paenibacillus sp. HJGM_3]|uniref:glutathionylspermidine synthase family protein n=1 Tax=Paenibacillus sp. HJGM_3 TaxID=3379816 RepID=UPI00385B8C69